MWGVQPPLDSFEQRTHFPPVPVLRLILFRSRGWFPSGLAADSLPASRLIPFPQVFWPEDVHTLRPASGRYAFSNLHALGQPNVLCASVRPEAAQAVEAMSDEQALGDVLALLQRMFPLTFVPPTHHKARHEPCESRTAPGPRASLLSVRPPQSLETAADRRRPERGLRSWAAGARQAAAAEPPPRPHASVLYTSDHMHVYRCIHTVFIPIPHRFRGGRTRVGEACTDPGPDRSWQILAPTDHAARVLAPP